MSRRSRRSESRTSSSRHRDRHRSSSRDKSKSKSTKEMTSFFEDDTPHGFVKRHIFRRHCEAFVAKTQNSKLQTIIYDAFAGAGYYSDGLPTEEKMYGSPLICLDVVIKYFKLERIPVCSVRIPEFKDPITYIDEDIRMPESENKVILNFSEANKGNCLKLVNNIFIVLNTIDAHFTRSYNSDGVITIESNNQNFSVCINVAHTKFKHVRPPKDKRHRRLMTFIDPFGYSQIRMQHVQRFIGEHKEVLINFMSGYVNRFKEEETTEDAICKLYGFGDEEKTERLEELRFGSDEDDGIDRCLKMYEKELQKRAKSELSLAFGIRNKKNVRLYHLICITNHIEGFKAMKEAMNRGSQDSYSLSMSDYYVIQNGMQLSLVNKQDKRVVAATIFQEFQGKQQIRISDIETFIWINTPYVWRRKALKILQEEPEDQPRLTNVADKYGNPPRRKCTYPSRTEWRLTFRTQSDEEFLQALPLQELRLK